MWISHLEMEYLMEYLILEYLIIIPLNQLVISNLCFEVSEIRLWDSWCHGGSGTMPWWLHQVVKYECKAMWAGKCYISWVLNWGMYVKWLPNGWFTTVAFYCICSKRPPHTSVSQNRHAPKPLISDSNWPSLYLFCL
jgi:hypothetical protein